MEFNESFPYPVRINWTNEQGTIWWNECCAMVIEIFGLPGNRYIYKPNLDHMTFWFSSDKDSLMCKLLLSDRS